jgi:hypothetical protein
MQASMPPKFEAVRTAQIAAELRGAFAEIEEMNLSWRGTRFEDYLVIIEANQPGAARPDPTTKDGIRALRLDFEATTQTNQLLQSRRAWPILDSTILRGKLSEVLKGNPFPPAEREQDHPRNTLFELVTASNLSHNLGLEVELTNAADARALIPGEGWFAVECKRPAGTEAGFKRNLSTIRAQLRTRRAEGDRGFAVLGIDRDLGLTRGFGVVSNEADLRHRATTTMTGYINRIKALARQNPQLYKLYPTAHVAALNLSCSVFLAEIGLVTAVSLFTVFCPGGDEREPSRRVVATLEGQRRG